MSPAQLTKNTMLVHVSLARCNLTDLENLDLPNLRSLDLSGNKIRTLSALMFARVRNLQILSLVDNPCPDRHAG
nr:hypothetical protein BaRGS_001687 [Batillaria attramentaria]